MLQKSCCRVCCCDVFPPAQLAVGVQAGNAAPDALAMFGPCLDLNEQ